MTPTPQSPSQCDLGIRSYDHDALIACGHDMERDAAVTPTMLVPAGVASTVVAQHQATWNEDPAPHVAVIAEGARDNRGHQHALVPLLERTIIRSRIADIFGQPPVAPLVASSLS